MNTRKVNYRIGASEVPIIMGCNPYKSIVELWNAKKKGLQNEHLDVMYKGELFEDDILQLFSIFTGYKIIHNSGANIEKFTALDGKLVCIPDGFVESEEEDGTIKRIPIEVKFTNNIRMKQAYVAQLATELYMLNSDYGYIVISTPDHIKNEEIGDMFDVICVDYDKDFNEKLEEKINEFIDSLSLDECPYKPNNIVEEYNEYRISEDASIDDICMEYERLSREIDELNRQKDGLKKVMRNMLGKDDLINGVNYAIRKVKINRASKIEIDCSFENVLRKYSIPYIFKQPVHIEYAKVERI